MEDRSENTRQQEQTASSQESGEGAFQQEPEAPPPPPPPPTAPLSQPGAQPGWSPHVQPPRRQGRSWWKWLLGCGCLSFLAFVMFTLAVSAIVGKQTSTVSFGPKVALVYVEGAITSGSSQGGLFGSAGATTERVISDLRAAEEQSGVRAIVLRINSPGGSAAASQEIYQEVLRIRESGKPVVVSMGDVAASGGYYIACAASEIFAGNGTLTGSIGVIFQTTDMSQLFGKIGLRPETIKSGKYKDMFSPNRPLTDEERQMAKSMILDIYNQFVDDVLAGRKHKGLTRQQLLAVADGRVMTGRQAMRARLVDRIGGLQDAINEAGRLGGISGKPSVWRVKRSFWETLAETASELRPVVNINLGGAGHSGAAEQLLGPAR
ncbi:MAG: hypothetical protein KatS3mg024_1044 [Armatimonadota bacterium]|nr:MAG: hypothetical protein KatS3mg024_1044 [Armatimonadota bacterium]